jgi:hypothetical protein
MKQLLNISYWIGGIAAFIFLLYGTGEIAGKVLYRVAPDFKLNTTGSGIADNILGGIFVWVIIIFVMKLMFEPKY